VACDDREGRLVYAPRLAVAEADMRRFGETSLVLGLEFGHVTLHQLDAFPELLRFICHSLPPYQIKTA
jgi:hypothetical protein